jgi:hypothetical protein
LEKKLREDDRRLRIQRRQKEGNKKFDRANENSQAEIQTSPLVREPSRQLLRDTPTR